MQSSHALRPHTLRRLGLMLAWAVALPAHAGLFDDDEARRRVEELRTQVTAMQATLETSQRAQLELSAQNESLKAEIARLRGQIEVLTYGAESADKRQKDFYIDLDSRLRKLETGAKPAADAGVAGAAGVAGSATGNAATAATNAAANAAGPTDAPTDSKDYEAALNLLRNGKFREAAVAFSAFIKKYPDSNFQPAANYWAGSSYYQLREFNRAAEFYKVVTVRYADNVKAPDAWMGYASSKHELGEDKVAKQAFETIVKKYPGTSQAEQAASRLSKLK